MAFTLEERQHMGIHGLLPPAVLSQDIQALRVMINFHRLNSKIDKRQSKHENKIAILFFYHLDDLDRYSELMNLSDRNEKLFYRVIAGKERIKFLRSNSICSFSLKTISKNSYRLFTLPQVHESD